MLDANIAMWVDQTKDEGVISVIRYKQQEEGEEKGEAKVEKQETVELPRPS